jgi:hypothetical protein
MKLTIAFALLVASCIGALSSSGGEKCTELAEALPLCAVLSNAAKYDGSEITVSGTYRMVIHGSVLMGAECSKVEVNLRQAEGYKVDKHVAAILRALTKKNQFQPVDEIIRGTFRVAKTDHCFGQICASFEIEVRELICASAHNDDLSPPKTSK